MNLVRINLLRDKISLPVQICKFSYFFRPLSILLQLYSQDTQMFWRIISGYAIWLSFLLFSKEYPIPSLYYIFQLGIKLHIRKALIFKTSSYFTQSIFLILSIIFIIQYYMCIAQYRKHLNIHAVHLVLIFHLEFIFSRQRNGNRRY